MNLVLFTAAVVGGLKHVIGRARPSAEEFQVLGRDQYVKYAFPSGHSALIASAYSYTKGRVKGGKRILYAVLVLLVAYSRLYLGMHFPSDVLAGIAIGMVVGRINLFARNKLFHRNFQPTKLEDELALVALLAAAVLAVMFLKSMPMAGLFIGFYAGFFLFKEMKLEQSILIKKWLAVKYAIGFAVLLVVFTAGEDMLGLGITLSYLERFAMYLIAGFWVSWIWPVVFERYLMPKQ